MQFGLLGFLFVLLIFALYRSRFAEERGTSTSWIIPYSIMSVTTGVLVDMLEKAYGLSEIFASYYGDSEIVSWEAMYFVAGVPLALVAEVVATRIYLRRRKETVQFSLTTAQSNLRMSTALQFSAIEASRN